MTRVWQCGQEWRSVTAGVEWNTINGAPSTDTTVKHGGSASLKISGNILTTATISVVSPSITALATAYFRWYTYIDTLPNNVAVVAFCDILSTTTNVVSIQFWNDAGTIYGIAYWNNFGNSSSSFTTNLSTGSWLRVEALYNTSPADGSEVLRVRINGTEVVAVTNATFTTKTVNNTSCGVYNGSAGTISTEVVYFDDVAINSSSGSANNSYPGEGKIVAALPTGAGDNAATTGIYSYINEVPPSNTATSGSTMVELDSNGVIADYAMTDSSTLGIDSYDTITAISVLARIREEAAGTSSYQLRIKSASGGTVTSTAAADAGNATARTNPNGTTAFGRLLISETDPTTGVAWTPTGTNSIDNMQCGLTNVDSDSTPDLWCLTLAAMVEYVDGTPPGGSVVKDIIGGFIPFAR